ncbi:MAG: hypothetical protein HY069_04830 [Chlamydiia bacterium]|nr:hypothetical protein [Chlamydiia bacterium]
MNLLNFLFLFAAAVSQPQQPQQKGQKAAPLPIEQAGSGTYGAVRIESIDAIGIVKLNGTHVMQAVQLQGSLIANDAQIDSFHVVGDANVSHCTVKKPSDVTGYIQAQKTLFQGDMLLTLQRAVFTHSTLQGVTIRPNPGFKSKQVLELRQHTVVQGPIVFESGNGEVHLFSGSKVLGGVTGGKVLQK